MKRIIALLKDESGATAIEYGLIAALLSIAIIAGLQGTATELNETFDKVSTELDTAQQ